MISVVRRRVGDGWHRRPWAPDGRNGGAGYTLGPPGGLRACRTSFPGGAREHRVNISRRVVVPVLLISVAVLVTSGALLLGSPGSPIVPGSSPATTSSPTPAALAPEHPLDRPPVTIRDFIFETERVRSPT